MKERSMINRVLLYVSKRLRRPEYYSSTREPLAFIRIKIEMEKSKKLRQKIV